QPSPSPSPRPAPTSGRSRPPPAATAPATSWTAPRPGSRMPAWPTSTSCSPARAKRSEEHTSELQSRFDLVCRLLLEKKNNTTNKLFSCLLVKTDPQLSYVDCHTTGYESLLSCSFTTTALSAGPRT